MVSDEAVAAYAPYVALLAMVQSFICTTVDASWTYMPYEALSISTQSVITGEDADTQ